MIKRFKLLLITILVCMFAGVITTHAADNNGYSVTPQFGTLPIQTGKQYFALNSQGHTKYRLPLLVKNNGDKPIKVKCSFNNAYTSSNGLIAYNNPKADIKNKQSVARRVVGKRTQTVVVPAKGTQVVSYEIKTDKQNPGLQLGGITTSALINQANGMKNYVNYVTGVSIGSQEKVPDLKGIKLTNATVSANQDKPNLAVTLDNKKPQLLQNYVGHLKLLQHGKIIKQHNFGNLSFAPTSKATLTMPVNDLHPGKYQVALQLVQRGNEHTYTNDLTITADKAAKVEDKRPANKVDKTAIYAVIVLLSVGMLIGIVCFVLELRYRLFDK